MQVACIVCSLRQKPLFHPFTSGELDFVASMKTAHVSVAPRIDIVGSGEVGGSLCTLFSGWAFRYRLLASGKRQILGFLLPGDLIGLEAALLGGIRHSVRTLTAASLCVLDGAPLAELFRVQPALAVHLMRTLVDEQRRADERMTQLGHLSGPQRLGYLLLEIFDRLRERDMAADASCAFPVQRQQLADALGLSRTHLIRSLAELQKEGLATIANNTLAVLDRNRLAALSGYDRVGRVGGRALL